MAKKKTTKAAAKKTTAKKKTTKAPKKEIKINDLGFPVGVPSDYKHIRARVLILEENLLAGEYGKEGSKMFIKAMRHYNHYSTMLNVFLWEMEKDPREKKFYPEKAFSKMYGGKKAS